MACTLLWVRPGQGADPNTLIDRIDAALNAAINFFTPCPQPFVIFFYDSRTMRESDILNVCAQCKGEMTQRTVRQDDEGNDYDYWECSPEEVLMTTRRVLTRIPANNPNQGNITPTEVAMAGKG